MLKRAFKLFAFALVAPLVVACGGSAPAPDDSVPPSDPRQAELPTLEGSWNTVLERRCAGVVRAAKPMERLHFGNGLMAYIERVPDTATERCHRALAFQRVAHAWRSGNDFYAEKADLIPYALREVCWSLADGRELRDTTVDASGATRSLNLEMDSRELRVVLSGMPECPTGLLELRLRR